MAETKEEGAGGESEPTLKEVMAAVAALSTNVTALATSQAELAKNQNTIAETLTKLPPAAVPATAKDDKSADAAQAAGAKEAVADAGGKPLTRADLEAFYKEQQQATQATAATKQLRERFAGELVKAKVPAWLVEQSLPATGDEAAFKAAAETLTANVNGSFSIKEPPKDTTEGGGNGVGKNPSPPAREYSNLSPNTAKVANAIKLPNRN